MKIKKIISALIALPVLAGLVACSEKEADYTPADVLTGEQVYFPNSIQTTIELSDAANTVTVPLNRVKTTDALSVNLVSTSTSEDITVASAANFTAGADAADVVISYSPDKIIPGHYDTITVSIAEEEYTTPYGSSKVTLLIGQKEPWVSIGTGYYYDAFMDDYMWAVRIEQNQLYPNRYRVVNPYKSMWTYYSETEYAEASADYFTFQIMEEGSTLGADADGNPVTIVGDDIVYFADANTGYYSSANGGDVWVLHASRFTSRSSMDYYQYSYVADYKEDGTPGNILLAPMYYIFGVGGWNHTMDSGYIQIVMPGFELSDYTLDVSYVGKFNDTDDNVYATANVFDFGEDVASVKIVVVSGADNVSGGINAILSAADDDPSIVTVDAEGTYNVPMPADAQSGKYTIVAVSFDEDGEAQEYAYDTFTYTLASVEETWTAKYVGDYVYTQFFTDENDNPQTDADLVLYQSNTDATRYKIEHWGYDVDFIFSVDPLTGIIEFDDFFCGYTSSSYGAVMCRDMFGYYGEQGGDPSFYADGVFTFNIGYRVSAGFFGYGNETFTITGVPESGAKSMAKAKKTGKSIANKKVVKETNNHGKVKGALAKEKKNLQQVEKANSYDLFSQFAK